MIISLLLSILGPILAELIKLWLQRRRQGETFASQRGIWLVRADGFLFPHLRRRLAERMFAHAEAELQGIPVGMDVDVAYVVARVKDKAKLDLANDV